MHKNSQQVADVIRTALANRETVRLQFMHEVDVDPEGIDYLLSDKLPERAAAIAVVLKGAADDLIELLNDAAELARKPNTTGTFIKPFYALDEAVPGGRHEVRLLRHLGKAVGRYVVPMDGEWSPTLDTVNKYHQAAVAAYEKSLEAKRAT